MDQDQLTRRRFVVSVIALSGAAGMPGLFSVSRAWAESGGDKSATPAMVEMARHLFPHDALSDDVYANVLNSALANAATSDAVAGALDAAHAALSERSNGDWQALDSAAQIEAMRGIEAEPFFAAIVGLVRYGIYHGQDFWEHVGYPGPSKQFGGYIDRGAGDIDWLPKESS
jgi:hypothetical protein